MEVTCFNIAAKTLYPPVTACLNTQCMNTKLLRNKDGMRKVVLFTIGDGACATYSCHRVCSCELSVLVREKPTRHTDIGGTACGSNYHHNFYVDESRVTNKTRTYYEGVPDVIQISEHKFMERKLLRLFSSLMLISW